MFSQVIRDRLPIIEPFIKTGAVLDLGCVDARTQLEGSAERIDHKPNLLHRRICELNPATIGIDIDPKGVEKLNAMGYRVRCEDVETMDLGQKFDVVIAGELIEHLENPGRWLRNMRRHMNPGGKIIISTPNPFYAGQTWKIWRYGKPMVHEDHMGWQDPTTLSQLLRRTGFEPVEGYWVQPHPAVAKTWKRLLREYFSHTFMIIAQATA